MPVENLKLDNTKLVLRKDAGEAVKTLALGQATLFLTVATAFEDDAALSGALRLRALEVLFAVFTSESATYIGEFLMAATPRDVTEVN